MYEPVVFSLAITFQSIVFLLWSPTSLFNVSFGSKLNTIFLWLWIHVFAIVFLLLSTLFWIVFRENGYFRYIFVSWDINLSDGRDRVLWFHVETSELYILVNSIDIVDAKVIEFLFYFHFSKCSDRLNLCLLPEVLFERLFLRLVKHLILDRLSHQILVIKTIVSSLLNWFFLYFDVENVNFFISLDFDESSLPVGDLDILISDEIQTQHDHAIKLIIH